MATRLGSRLLDLEDYYNVRIADEGDLMLC